MSLKDKLKKKNDPKDGSWDHDMCGKEPVISVYNFLFLYLSVHVYQFY